jgi:hypothetical protein
VTADCVDRSTWPSHARSLGKSLTRAESSAAVLLSVLSFVSLPAGGAALAAAAKSRLLSIGRMQEALDRVPREENVELDVMLHYSPVLAHEIARKVSDNYRASISSNANNMD